MNRRILYALLAALPLLAACSPSDGDDGVSAAPPADADGALYRAIGLEESGSGWLDPCGQPVQAEIQRVDLNGDGTEEAFVLIHGICLGGGTGSHLSLLTRDADGGWIRHLGFPAVGYELGEQRVDGWPDLYIQGMGDCLPAWRWNGSTYALHEPCP